MPDNRINLEQALDECNAALFGPNKECFLHTQQEHVAERQELIDRHRRATQELIDAALDRLTFFGGDRLAHLGEAHTITQAQREDLDKELHDALAEARTRYDRKVNALLGEAKDGE